jgi:asparagine synthase (glutamine-hydrolysing)
LRAYMEEYYSLLSDAVRLRLRADVRVGTTFSGGLDSSSLVHVIHEQFHQAGIRENQLTFSLLFGSSPDTASCDESRFVREVTDRYDVQPHAIEPSAADVRDEYARMVYVMDTPQDDSLMSCMFTYRLVARSGVVVSLDGQGADELQGGYLRYLVNLFTNMRLSSLVPAAAAFRHIPNAGREIAVGGALALASRLGLQTASRRALAAVGKKADPFLSPNGRLLADFTGNLRNLLHYGDRASMAYSVEARYPHLDYRLARFWFGVPASYKLHNGWTKYVARRTFAGRLPDPIVWRRDKMGWEIPEAYWFGGALNGWARQEIASSEFLRALSAASPAIQELQKSHARQRLSVPLKLLNLAHWHRIFFDQRPSVVPLGLTAIGQS